MRKVIMITKGILRQELGSVRVMMGYLLGVTFLALSLNDFLAYAVDMKEPVNIFEAFIVTENQGTAGRFWILGYLLVIADAPFVKGNTYILLYRSGRRVWNMGMLLYVFLQALMYTMCFAVISVIVNIPYGFPGGIWSSPVYMLATVPSNAIAEKYHIFFEGAAMMKHMTVLQAFGITFLYMLCYFVFLGVLLYVCNLVFGGFWGLAAVAAVHLGGVILSFAAGLHQNSAYFVDGAGSHWRYPGMMLAFILVLALVSLFAVGRVEIQTR
ncbi:MAG: hypothetical protein HFH82_03240 [Lachnospiraceae bacterium]|nr:hypothetical protein [Lachnospiraceae bacterium]